MPLEGMEDSLYGDDAPTPDAPQSEEPQDGKPDSVDEQEAMDPTSLVDLKVLTGKHGAPKEGDEIVVKVVKIHGNEAEIAYAPDKPDSKEESDESDMEALNKAY